MHSQLITIRIEGMNDELFSPPPPERHHATSQPSSRRRGEPPLADRMRPESLAEMVGQADLLGADGPLLHLLESDKLDSVILWGPPGCGKTTLARLMAKLSAARFLEYSAVAVGAKELKAVMAEAEKWRRSSGQRTILFLDEIHRFNKAQQDALLPWVERGDVTLIGATTENPSFEVNAALLSRTRLLVLAPLSPHDVHQLLERALSSPRGLAGQAPSFTPAGLTALAEMSEGDARVALNLLEAIARVALASGTDHPIAPDDLSRLVQHRAVRYDKAGEEHYNLISALHKSLRNSDVQASLYWLARMLEGGEDPLYLARRLVRFASEDVGLADPVALSQAVAARDAVHFIGLPEGTLALAQATVYLALAPKSNALYTGYAAASAEVRRGDNPPTPLHLRNAPTPLLKELGYGRDYIYAHATADGIAAMDCLPASLQGRSFYHPTGRGYEKELADRMQRIARWRARQHEETPPPANDTD
jgi:putative ATPase